jgi:putative protein-disulfide isomerase
MTVAKKLYYVYDPMCSWCWGFKPVWNEIENAISSEVDVTYVLGGLAPDSNVPMPEPMQQQIAAYWKKIEEYLGTQFNYAFWSENTPRRSTYPSCRAVLAARSQNAEKQMLGAIQHAYYLNAKNPSDDEVLISLANDLELDSDRFRTEFFSKTVHQQLLREIQFARSIGGNSFPSLFVETTSTDNNRANTLIELPVDYLDAQVTIERIRDL